MEASRCLAKRISARTGRLATAILLSLIVALTATGMARADTGPKPSMEFTFVQELEPAVTIVGGTLLECEDPECTQSEPLQELGPQRFSCTADHCSSMAYGYAEYHQLVIRFSDGVERRSNIFVKQYFAATYTVTVGESALEVKEGRGRANPSLLVILLVLAALAVPAVIVLVLIIVLAVKAGRAPLSFADARGAYVITWVLSVLVGVVSAIFDAGLPVTLLIEGVLAAGYALIRKRSAATIVTVVLLVNLLTQPLLWMAALALGGSWPANVAVTLILETAVWLIEAGVLALTLRRTANFLECLVLSFVLNVASFGIGLLLPW